MGESKDPIRAASGTGAKRPPGEAGEIIKDLVAEAGSGSDSGKGFGSFADGARIKKGKSGLEGPERVEAMHRPFFFLDGVMEGYLGKPGTKGYAEKRKRLDKHQAEIEKLLLEKEIERGNNLTESERWEFALEYLKGLRAKMPAAAKEVLKHIDDLKAEAEKRGAKAGAEKPATVAPGPKGEVGGGKETFLEKEKEDSRGLISIGIRKYFGRRKDEATGKGERLDMPQPQLISEWIDRLLGMEDVGLILEESVAEKMKDRDIQKMPGRFIDRLDKAVADYLSSNEEALRQEIRIERAATGMALDGMKRIIRIAINDFINGKTDKDRLKISKDAIWDVACQDILRKLRDEKSDWFDKIIDEKKKYLKKELFTRKGIMTGADWEKVKEVKIKPYSEEERDEIMKFTREQLDGGYEERLEELASKEDMDKDTDGKLTKADRKILDDLKERYPRENTYDNALGDFLDIVGFNENDAHFVVNITREREGRKKERVTVGVPLREFDGFMREFLEKTEIPDAPADETAPGTIPEAPPAGPESPAAPAPGITETPPFPGSGSEKKKGPKGKIPLAEFSARLDKVGNRKADVMSFLYSMCRNDAKVILEDGNEIPITQELVDEVDNIITSGSTSYLWHAENLEPLVKKVREIVGAMGDGPAENRQEDDPAGRRKEFEESFEPGRTYVKNNDPEDTLVILDYDYGNDKVRFRRKGKEIGQSLRIFRIIMKQFELGESEAGGAVTAEKAGKVSPETWERIGSAVEAYEKEAEEMLTIYLSLGVLKGEDEESAKKKVLEQLERSLDSYARKDSPEDRQAIKDIVLDRIFNS